jgi:hypothetical protein
MDRQQKRMGLAQTAFSAVRELATLYDDAERAREAENLASEAIAMLAATKATNQERVREAYRALFGGRPSDDVGIRIREVAAALEYSAEMLRHEGEHGGYVRAALLAARSTLERNDARFTALSDDVILGAARKIRDAGSTSGALADLAHPLGALGVNPKSERSGVQQRFAGALKNR